MLGVSHINSGLLEFVLRQSETACPVDYFLGEREVTWGEGAWIWGKG